MKAYSKTITYILETMSEMDLEIELESKNGWKVFKISELKNSYVFPPKKEIEITYLLRNYCP